MLYNSLIIKILRKYTIIIQFIFPIHIRTYVVALCVLDYSQIVSVSFNEKFGESDFTRLSKITEPMKNFEKKRSTTNARSKMNCHLTTISKFNPLTPGFR